MSLLSLPTIFSGCAMFHRTDPINLDSLPPFNRLVLEVAREYPADGTHGYWWPRNGESNYDGCTRDMYLCGRRVMEGEPEGRTYCCGFTLEVFLEAYNRWLAEHPVTESAISGSTWPRFQRLWFVLETNGPGPSSALEEFHLGRAIEEQEDVLPGDFIALWRTEQKDGKLSGHSVIFLAWIRNLRGEIVGMRYISTQPGTNGIGEATEYYGASGGLSRHFCHVGRAEPDAGS